MAHVLVIDDAPEVCRAMTAFLRGLGHEADCVHSGRDALGYLRAVVPDLIVLDVMMPDLDGPDVLRAVRASPHTRTIPVVVYSALMNPSCRDEMFALGANDYWVKSSAHPEALEHRIGELLLGSPTQSQPF